MPQSLYEVQTKNYDSYFALADSYDDAANKVKEHLATLALTEDLFDDDNSLKKEKPEKKQIFKVILLSETLIR